MGRFVWGVQLGGVGKCPTTAIPHELQYSRFTGRRGVLWPAHWLKGDQEHIDTALVSVFLKIACSSAAVATILALSR